MIRNYLRIALRNFGRQKGFTLLNVTGLAIGLASATFIYLFIINENGYDRFHPDADNLYVLGAQGKINGVQQATVMAPGYPPYRTSFRKSRQPPKPTRRAFRRPFAM